MRVNEKCVEQENLSAKVAYGGFEGIRLVAENRGIQQTDIINRSEGRVVLWQIY